MRCTSLFSDEGTSTFVISKGGNACRISWVVGEEEYKILRDFVDDNAKRDARVSGLVLWAEGDEISVGADNKTHSFDDVFDKEEFLLALDRLLERHRKRFPS
ncbi:hypothetical protein C8_301 [Cannes 8 virus]|uniref:Uncharacterized protein n=1 Tax=Marseillevirus marseillevirus TaxID=694581 RepID=D2XAT5_GBMV|nr:hypothetical protein MAR_ORF288 [Marseillevirus marseillevirus]YP_009094759.1 hypothetical protein MEL_258 [Melbournevirus]AGV01650.1 hypothetical protein C8_301 [Cannes 8 virus]AVR53004.1 hypothetical protein MarSH_299 [Marseillevirus Shanghai 1]ADB04062.1 hypothetical protein MAR_ORF288 [Marseillevirus marseillevirus]AIT54871.1 hypothetical protein MEL_258 [Melbournevirus]